MSKPTSYEIRVPIGCNNCRYTYKTTILPRGIITFCNIHKDRPPFGSPEWPNWAAAHEVNTVYGTCKEHTFSDPDWWKYLSPSPAESLPSNLPKEPSMHLLPSLKQIADAKTPEEIFGALNGTDRTGLVGTTTPILLANLAIECSAIHEGLLFDTLEPSDAILRKLWFMQNIAARKIRHGIYGRQNITATVVACGHTGSGTMDGPNFQPNVVSLAFDIPLEKIHDLLKEALEGGSRYWCEVDSLVKPTALWTDKPSTKKLDYPLSPDGAIIIVPSDEEEPKKYRLDLNTIKSGLAIMAQKHPRCFSDFLTDDYDPSTADAFLQCCLFGELVYG